MMWRNAYSEGRQRRVCSLLSMGDADNSQGDKSRESYSPHCAFNQDEKETEVGEGERK